VQIVVGPTGFVGAPEHVVVDYIRSSFLDRPRPDLVVAVAGPAAVFARRYRQELFPDTPILFASVDRRFLDDAPLADNEAAVAVSRRATSAGRTVTIESDGSHEQRKRQRATFAATGNFDRLLNHNDAVKHVHPAGEGEVAWLGRRELNLHGFIQRKRSCDVQSWKHHCGATRLVRRAHEGDACRRAGP
jgi:hypothetical protein